MDYTLGKAMEQARTLAAGALGVREESVIIVGGSKNPELGDLSCPACFEISKRNPKAGSPMALAQNAAEKINAAIGKASFLEKATALNGYVNFNFSQGFYALAAHEAAQKEFGRGSAGEGKAAIVEYSSPNIGKPMHVGHIRSTILGESIARLMRFSGYSVVSSNYLCEAGTQTAKLLLAAELFGPAKISTEKDLLGYYVRIHTELEGKPELEAKVREFVEKMEAGDKATLALLKKIRKVSVEPFHRNYKTLGVKFTEEVFDSDFVEAGKEFVKECVEKGIAFADKNGETVGSLESLGLPNLVILRSNGTTLYSTRDLALAQSRWEKYRFDSCLIVTASEQNLHFRQVIAMLNALGRPYAQNYAHLGFGLISLEAGKMSTRAGRVLILEDVIDSAVEMALAEVKTRQEYGEAQAEKIARAVGIGALKYSILRIQAEKDITFKIADAVKFEGNTAAYLQYTVVRAHNIIAKAGEENPGKPAPKATAAYEFNASERRLIGLLSSFPQVCANSSKSRSPATLCNYLFELASAFSSFYDASPVLKAESATAKAARLQIVRAASAVLTTGLSLLSIEVPDKM